VTANRLDCEVDIKKEKLRKQTTKNLIEGQEHIPIEAAFLAAFLFYRYKFELAFVYNELTIAISETANEDQMEQMLGKPDNMKSHTYRAGDGTNMDTLIGFTEKVYTYPGLEIKTISIPEGKLLGDGASDEEDDFRYEPSNYVDVMSFHIKDAKVESIQIYSLLD